jgi:hypothetical protein
MNQSGNQNSPCKRGWFTWSVIRKYQLIGTAIGATFTIGIFAYALNHSPDSIMSPSSLLLLLVWAPVLEIRGVFGLKAIDFDISGGLSPFMIILAIVINSFLCFLLGSIVGKLRELTNNYE